MRRAGRCACPARVVGTLACLPTRLTRAYSCTAPTARLPHRCAARSQGGCPGGHAHPAQRAAMGKGGARPGPDGAALEPLPIAIRWTPQPAPASGRRPFSGWRTCCSPSPLISTGDVSCSMPAAACRAQRVGHLHSPTHTHTARLPCIRSPVMQHSFLAPSGAAQAGSRPSVPCWLAQPAAGMSVRCACCCCWCQHRRLPTRTA